MNDFIRYIAYTGNIGVGMLFTSHIVSMRIQNCLKSKTAIDFKKDNLNLRERFSLVFGVPIEKSKELILIFELFLLLTVISVISSGPLNGLMVMISCMVCIYIMKKTWERSVKDLFQKNAYKLYRYLVSQISAGVKPKDVIINMYKITEDKTLKKILAKASGAYAITLDGKSYAKILKQEIKTEDAARFAMILEEDLLYSDNENFLEKMEEMMFNRHFSYQQKKTEKIKRGCFLAVSVFMLIVIIMVALPLMNELMQGLKYIFN